MKIIDIHTHGIGGCDTKTSSPEDILRIAGILGSYGVSEIIPAIYSSSVNVMRENIGAVKKAMELQDARYEIKDTKQFPPLVKGCKGGLENHASGIGHRASEPGFPNTKPAKIIGVHLEGPFLNAAKCGALSAESFIEPTEYNFQKLVEGFEDIVKIITIAPELKGASGLIREISDMGVIVSMGHSDATYAEAEAGFHSGARGITHIFNAMRMFHHREPGLAGFGLLNEDIYVEVIADPFHLHVKTLELLFKRKNTDRIIIVSDTVRESRTSPDTQAITNTQNRLSGGCMTIIESSRRLVAMGYDNDVIQRCITTNPERYLSGL
jgi:N-acetylglucosamine-6-phosphate deacetylase